MTFLDPLLGLLLLASIFIPLEHYFSLHPQKILRPGWKTDLIYYFSGNLIGRIINGLIALGVAAGMTHGFNLGLLTSEIQKQPIFIQLLEIIIVAELGYYFAHRLLHSIPFLWRFHAIHHSAEQLDWLVTIKVHPLEQIFTRIFQFTPVLLLNLSIKALAIYGIFSAIIAFFIHANLKLSFGILNWFLVTPQLHHWHHVNHPSVMNKNFAAQCSLIDRIFGTYYLPRDLLPENYGISETVPTGYVAQLLYPWLGNQKARI